MAARRAAMLDRARAWFRAHSVLGVDTPALAAATVTDPHIESLAAARSGYLVTSPEYAMKRLLAAGYPDIHSICRVFRGAESGRRHLPEFTMIEWYRRGFDLDAIIEDTLGLVSAMLGDAAARGDALGIDYRQLFREQLGVDPLIADVSQLADAAAADERLRTALGERRDAWLDLLLATVIAPQFPPRRLTVIRHYPASQAALARLCPDDPAVADRFELFAGSLELANGYVELTDADEQAMRFARDRTERQALGLPDVRADERLLAALRAGLPPCAGVALGFERLHMYAENTDDIGDVVTFTEHLGRL